MSHYKLKILKSDYIAHNIKRFVLERPDHYSFIPGQGTDVAIDEKGWDKQFRPFTFTSPNDWPYLELITKIYDDRNSMTARLGRLNSGSHLILGEPYGMIRFDKPGVFIAGGSGITPFLAIFRSLVKTPHILKKCELIYSNRTEGDAICREELSGLFGERYYEVFTHNNSQGLLERQIDRNFLTEHISDFSQQFYICGPEPFVKDIIAILLEMGAVAETLIF